MNSLSKIIFALFVLSSSTILYAQEPTLREKIGQMLLIGFEGKSIDKDSAITHHIAAEHIGGVILFDYNFKTNTNDKNIESPAQVQELNRRLQEVNQAANEANGRPNLPLIISVDYEGGAVNRLSSKYGFPNTYSAADVGKMNPFEASAVAEEMAKTLEDNGFNLDFAPVLDVNVNPENPIIGKLGRSFSDNPDYVAQYSQIYSSHFLNHGVQCAYKHFPGHGSSTSDSHLGLVDVTNTWQAYELDPYQHVINNNGSCGMIMTAHIVNRQLDESGLPATLSHKILTELLREKLQYKGLIITDDMQMKAITEQYGKANAITLAINAGADMLLFGNQLADTQQDPKEIINIIESKVRTGEIEVSRIDDAYQHILTFKRIGIRAATVKERNSWR